MMKARLKRLEMAVRTRRLFGRPQGVESKTDEQLEEILRAVAIDLDLQWYPQSRTPTDEELERLITAIQSVPPENCGHGGMLATIAGANSIGSGGTSGG